jgi:hypothetical protein
VLGVVDSDLLERFEVWVRFLSLRVCRFCLVFEFEYCWNWEGASCWKPFASYSRNIDDDDDDDVRGAGRPGGGAMKSLLGVLNRTETFALLFDLSLKNVLLYFLGFLHFCVVLLVPNVVVVVAEKLVLLGTSYYVL